jgi:hypothetical protein
MLIGFCSAACASTPTLEFQDSVPAPQLPGLGSELAVTPELPSPALPAASLDDIVLASEHVEGWTSHGPVELALFCCLRGLDRTLVDPTPPPPPVEPLPTDFVIPQEPTRDWYVGIGAGWTTSGLSPGEIENTLDGFGNDILVALDDTHGGLKVFAGHRFSEHWAVEFGYTGLEGLESEIIESGPPQPGLAEEVADSHPVTGEGIGLALRATTFERAGFAASAHLGLWAWQSNLEVNLNNSRLVVEEDGLDLFFGLGLQYRTTDRTTLRLEWNQYLLDDDEVHLFTLGFHHEL